MDYENAQKQLEEIVKSLCEDIYVTSYEELIRHTDSFISDLRRLKKMLEEKSATKEAAEEFFHEAVSFNAPWYDEDLECYRSGYEWESRLYLSYANIVNTAIGLPVHTFGEVQKKELNEVETY